MSEKKLADVDVAFASIEEVAALFRKRKVSPVELTRLMLRRIAEMDKKLNAYLTVCPEVALAEAKEAEAELFGKRGKRRDRGPLHGIPISLKDNIETAGLRTTAGSQVLRDFVPRHDAAIVTQLREAGAVVLGKTNMHEFAYGVTSNNPHFGPVRNPWDAERIPGGSSGGSGAAVAAGLCYGSIGTDTGGSIRIPAALCGVVGLKPTLGRVSVAGTIPLSPTLDCVGPLARSAGDVARMASPIFARQKGEKALDVAAKTVLRKKLRLGVPQEFLKDEMSGEIRGAFEAAVEQLERDGARRVSLSMPLIRETEDAGNHIAWAEATHYHEQAGWFPAKAAEYGSDVRSRLEAGGKVTATAYLKAFEMRKRFIAQLQATMEENKLDALAVPTTPIAAPKIGEETTAVNGKNYPTRALLLRFNRPANLAGLPAITIPCKRTQEGLPIGLQLVGAADDEALLLEIARRLERFAGVGRPPISF
jgi:aspartyl-tRNA(Asn)/glutamyl-tRNA(Gln) amidotransferase subunit A